MPTACKTHCLEPGCGVLVDRGRCIEHTQTKKVATQRTQHRTHDQNEHRRLLRGARWVKLRRWKLNRNPMCESQGCNRAAECVDHITSTAKGGEMYNMDNLQSLCWSCHSRKTVAEDGGWGKTR